MNQITARAAARAAEISTIAGRALDWVGQQQPKNHALMRELRRDARRARALQEAAARPVAVAVFGASQAGKSYLVSRLAAPLGHPLAARFGTTELDFLRDINPPGGQEATGLVTRFTVKPPAGPADAAVALRLLSQTDVVKILANTYLEDFDPAEVVIPDLDQLTTNLKALESAAGPGPQDGLQRDDIEELQDYFARYFRGHALIQSLPGSFWERLADLVPRLPAERRAEAFAPLWGGVGALSACCTLLLGALKQLGFQGDVRAGIDALVPRETSIIDVRTLFTMNPAQPSGNTIALRNASGGTLATLDRVVVTALVAEITMPLASNPWPFFDHTDLLDFPGARTREEISDAENFLKGPERLGRVFLRGKVAYLFQRYNAEQEISAMLLCVGPSNQEVQTLPRMVDDWIAGTAGPTPADRANVRCNMFLVLTKFDSEFEEKAGEDVASGQRWTARMQASLTDFFGKAYSWPHEWTPGKAFNNTFWLRNPSIGFGAVFDYEPQTDPDQPAVEIGVAPRAEAAVKVRRDAYMANELVRTFFADPGKAWDEALRANDGGISYLAAALAPVCDPHLKAQQVGGRSEAIASSITARLRPFYHGGDAAERIEQARKRARAVAQLLARCAANQMLGSLLRSLQVETDQVAAVYWRQQNDATTGTAPVGTATTHDDYADFLMDDEAPATPAAAPVAAGPRDAYEHLADLALEDWAGHMRNLAENENASAAFAMTPEQLLDLAGEITQAARRLNLRDTIASTLRGRAGFQGRVGATEAKQVAIVEAMLNNFVYQLGWDAVELGKRPRAPRSEQAIFLPRTPDKPPPELPEHAEAFEAQFNKDWITAVMQTIEDNARSTDGVEFDVKANEALGTMLKGLAPQAA